MTRPAVLAIGATDSSGGAGLTRDVQVLGDFAVDALCAVTAVTAQSDARVAAIHPVPPELVRAQIAAALATRPVGAIKIGVLATRAAVMAVAEALPDVPTVLDPVLAATSGGRLLDEPGRRALCEALIPRVTLLTPNVPETAALLGEAPARDTATLLDQAYRLLRLGMQAVLVKGGHAQGPEAVDLLVRPHGEVVRFATPRFDVARRGTGCMLSASIAAGLALGMPLDAACRRAKTYVSNILRT